MRSRWFHVPLFHTALHHEKKVSWLELFYDLIFVAAIIQLGDALSDGIDRGEGVFALASFAGHFVPLWLAWTGFTFYANRYIVDDFLHRILVFVQMFAVGAMGIAAPHALGAVPQPRPFAMAFAVAQGVLAILYLRAWRQVPEAREYTRYWGLIFAFGATVWAVSCVLERPLCYVLWAIGVGAILFAPLTKASRVAAERHPIDQEHLAERYGLLIIIVLGESFVKVLSFLAESESGPDLQYLLKGCFNLLITCCVWWIYFDDVASSHIKKGQGNWVVWLFGHLPLAIGATAVGVAVKKAIKYDFSAIPDARSYWLLSGALAVTFLSVAIIDSVTERKEAEVSDRYRVALRVFSSAVLLLVAQIGTTMVSGVFLGIIAVICAAQVIFDMAMAPWVEGQGQAAMKTVALADGPPPTRRRQLTEAVRKGTPTDLRRDLYFFFIEGSWTRVIASLAFGYVMVNVLFAALYLIEPSSIGLESSRSFRAAFSFSVQTFSTIGYGAITPQTAYGDAIVAIEAATGLLCVALATGLMFAKASRPRSSVLFSKNILVTQMHGKPTLMFRVGNARGNEVVDASINVAVLIDTVTPEGHQLRRLHDLPLTRSRTPLFVLTWAVMHVIDDTSPLKDIDWRNPRGVSNFVVTMLGHDATYGTTTHARHMYYPEDVKCDTRFVDIMSVLEDGRMMIDYTRFHDTEPDSPQPNSSEPNSAKEVLEQQDEGGEDDDGDADPGDDR